MRPLRATLRTAGLLLAAFAGPANVQAEATCERVEYVMGTMLRVAVTATSEELACQAVDSAFAIVHRLDSLLSNYKPDSEISQLTQRAPERLTASPVVVRFIHETLGFWRASGGALNPAVRGVQIGVRPRFRQNLGLTPINVKISV